MRQAAEGFVLCSLCVLIAACQNAIACFHAHPYTVSEIVFDANGMEPKEGERVLTLFDLLHLVRHYWKGIAVSAVACAVAALLAYAFFLPSEYRATAKLIVMDASGTIPASSLVALADNSIQELSEPYIHADSDYAAAIQFDASSTAPTFVVTIEGSDGDACVALANSIVENAAAQLQSTFEALDKANKEGLANLSVLNDAEDLAGVLSGSLIQDILGTDRTFEFCSVLVNEAVRADESGIGPAALALLAFAFGLFAAFLVVVGIDLVRRPIMGSEDVSEASGLKVLGGSVGGGSLEQLWANVCFSAGNDLRSLCLVPLSYSCDREWGEAFLRAARSIDTTASLKIIDGSMRDCGFDGDGTDVVLCQPISQGVGASYCAREAQATVVVVRAWKDSLRELAVVLNDLKLAKANIIGVAFVG